MEAKIDALEKKMDILIDIVTELRIQQAVTKTKLGITAGFFGVIGGVIPALVWFLKK